MRAVCFLRVSSLAIMRSGRNEMGMLVSIFVLYEHYLGRRIPESTECMRWGCGRRLLWRPVERCRDGVGVGRRNAPSFRRSAGIDLAQPIEAAPTE